jgi:MEMO1 family protein
MREMVAAGKFYEAEQRKLNQQIDECYAGPRGPGDLPLSKLVHKVEAIIVPSSPYKNCGDCMAWAYKEIAESPKPDVYVILAGGSTAVCLESFQTPLGIVRVDQELAKALVAKGNVQENAEAFKHDHHIEVQLPFLQHAKKQEMEHIKILPILIGDADLKTIALDIEESLIELKRNAIFIISTNLTQHGPLFHHVPFSVDVLKNIQELDKGAIDLILAKDVAGFAAYTGEKMMNISGSAPIELLLHLLKGAGRLEQYYTSADVLGDEKNIVAYSVIIFEKK